MNENAHGRIHGIGHIGMAIGWRGSRQYEHAVVSAAPVELFVLDYAAAAGRAAGCASDDHGGATPSLPATSSS